MHLGSMPVCSKHLPFEREREGSGRGRSLLKLSRRHSLSREKGGGGWGGWGVGGRGGIADERAHLPISTQLFQIHGLEFVGQCVLTCLHVCNEVF